MKLRLKYTLPAAAIPLAVLLYFFLTSSFFGVTVLLPVVGRCTGLQLAARSVSWSPIRGTFELRGMRLGPAGEPFLLAKRASGEIRLRRLLRRQINAPILELEGAELAFCRDARNRWNFTRLIEAAVPDEDEPDDDGEIGVYRLELERIAIRRSRIIAADHTPDRGGRLEIDQFEAEANRYGNDLNTQLRASGRLRMVSGRDLSLTGRLSVQAGLESGGDLSLRRLALETNLSQLTGKIADRPLAAGTIEGDLELADAGPHGWEIRRFSLRQKLSDTVRSRVEIAGTLQPDPFRCDLNLSARISDELTAALSDCLRGVNPGRIQLVAEGHVTAGDEKLDTSGTLNIVRAEGEAQFGRERLTLPGFELKLRHHLSADLAELRFDIEDLQAELLEDRWALARVTLNRPFAYNAAASRIETPDASLSLKLVGLPIPLLRLAFSDPAFIPAAGSLDGDLTLELTPEGQPELTGSLNLTEGAFRSGAWRLDRLTAEGILHGVVGRDGALSFDRLRLRAARDGADLGEVSGTAVLTPHGGTGSCQLQFGGVTERWLPLLPPCCRPFAEPIPPELFPAALSGSGRFRFGPGFGVCEDLRLRLDAAGGAVLKAELPKQLFSAQGAEENWDITLRAELDAAAFRRLVPAARSLTRGEIAAETRIHAARRFQTIGIETGFDLKGGGLPLPERADAALDFHSDLACFLNDNGRLQLNNFDAALRVDGNPALRISGTGHYDRAADRAEGTLRIRYLNNAFLDAVLPGRLTDGLVAGELRAEASPRRGRFLLNGNLSMDKFRTPGSTRPFFGKGQFRVARDDRAVTLSECSFNLADSIKPLASVRLAATLPHAPEEAAALRIAANGADLWTMYEDVAPAPAAPESADLSFFAPARRPAAERVPFYFGNRPILLDLDLRDLRWKSGVFDLKGGVRLYRNRAETTAPAHLFINGADLVFDLAMDDRPAGMALRTRAKAASPIELTPLLTLIEDAPSCSGTLSEFTWDLAFEQLLSSEWYRGFRGEADGRFADLDVRYTKADHPLARLVLLPVELLVRAGTLVPDTLELRSNWEKLLTLSAPHVSSPFSKLHFRQGRFALTAEENLLHVRELMFRGDPVRELAFTGMMTLPPPNNLDLTAKVEVGTLAAQLPIRGPLDAPEPEVGSMFQSVTGASLEALLKRLGNAMPEAPVRGETYGPFIRLLRDLAGFEERPAPERH